MCVMCNGGTIEDVFRILHLQIVNRGFAVVPVGTKTENRGWAYTIGLIDSKDHPELVVAGYPLDRAVNILDELGAAVMAGDRLDSPVVWPSTASRSGRNRCTRYTSKAGS